VSDYAEQPFVARMRRAASARGAAAVGRDLARWGGHALTGWPWTVVGSRGHFEFQGERYPYLFHRYKRTWLTERAVEVPVVQTLVDRQAGGRVLEVGNVLSHYRPQNHLVVDRYERSPDVLNRDVLELQDLGPFALIVAVSTLEHVGWDEHPRDPGKAMRAVGALRELLEPGGQLVLTVPVGYNAAFDQALRDGDVPFSRVAALRRTGAGTRWEEVTVTEIWSAPYDFLLYAARGVLFAFIDREAGDR
jgi:hypothetical protein